MDIPDDSDRKKISTQTSRPVIIKWRTVKTAGIVFLNAWFPDLKTMVLYVTMPNSPVKRVSSKIDQRYSKGCHGPASCAADSSSQTFGSAWLTPIVIMRALRSKNGPCSLYISDCHEPEQHISCMSSWFITWTRRSHRKKYGEVKHSDSAILNLLQLVCIKVMPSDWSLHAAPVCPS